MALRRAQPPRSLLDLLPRRDRVLASARLAPAPDLTEAWAVATVAALAVLDLDDLRTYRPWIDVDRARWDAETSTVTVLWVDRSADTVLALAPGAPRAFPEVVRERVQSSVVHVERLTLPAKREVRAVVRRSGDGSLLSQLIIPRGAPLTAQQARAVEALESRARQAAGMGA